MQQVLIVSTEQDSLRSEIYGWTHEDPSLYVRGKHIGHTRSAIGRRPKTVLEALADGWSLLAPPRAFDPGIENCIDVAHYEWWLTKGAGGP